MSGVARLTIPTALYAVSNEYTYANLSASNAVTTSNILTTNVTVSGGMFIAGTATVGSVTLGVTGNIYVSNAITTTNISAATAVFTGPIRVDSNIYSSNAVTTKNVFLRGRIVLNTETGPAEGKTTVQSTDNILISNSILTTNVWTSVIKTTGRVTADGQPGATTMFLSGNSYVSNSVTTNNVFSLGNVFVAGNVTTSGQAQVMSSNLYVSNTVTTGNVFVGKNVTTGNLFSSGNIVTLNAFTTTNIFASNVIAIGYVSAQNLVSTNVSVSNAITTTNVWTTNVISTGDLTFAGLTGKTTIDVTGNAYVSNAITTTNVWTSNIYASGKLSFAGLPNLTTLYSSSNISVSNTILTTNVWTANLVSTGDLIIRGDPTVSAGITTLQVTGNTMVTHTVTSGNVYASGNIYVTADSQSVTGNIFMANALVTANLWSTLSVNAGVGVYVDKTVILTDPTLGALAATVYTGAGQGTIVRTGHMPMHPALTTAPTGVWAGDTYFDNNFLYKYTTSTWRSIELLYPTAVPVIAAIGNQAGSSLGQRVVEVTQTATPFSSLGTVLWTISGAPTGTVIEGGSNSGCFIVIPVTTTALVGSYTVVVGASNERGSAANQSFALTMPSATASPFTLTLNASNVSRLGDDDATITSFWSGENSGALSSKGKQTYDGYYACTLNTNKQISVTANGASGWRNTNGRSITAVFNLTAGTRLVFFAGKATAGSGSQGQGAGGGASVVATYSGGTFTPLVIAAGGSASYSSRRPELSAKPLSLSEGVDGTVGSQRNSYRSGSGNTGSGGVGRSSDGGAQSGGAGWFTRAFWNNVSIDTSGPQALNAGAQGGPGVNSNASAGGFGGGGGDYDNNSYGAGGGGYWGGWETSASGGTTASYAAYTSSNGDIQNNYLGPMSYVDSSRVSRTDNGIWGADADTAETGGRVVITFT